MSKDRLEIFSDAVFAIIMTLLVLELHVPEVPEHASFAQYAAAMAPLWPKIAGFILTFVTIAIHWVSHHYFFRHITKATIGMVWLNMFFLLWLCFLPFPTAMLGDHPTDQFPIVLYAANSLLLALTFFAMRKHANHNGLFKEDKETSQYMGPRRSLPAILLFSLAIVSAFVNVYFALACVLLVPVLYFVPNVLHHEQISSE